jgi:flagellar protein FliO/FliZ
LTRFTVTRLPLVAAALLALALALANPAAALAQGFTRDETPLSPEVTGGGEADAPAEAPSADTGGALTRMVVGLLVVLAVIYGIYWLLKTYGRSRTPGGRGDGRVEVVATTTLAPNRTLHLVRSGDEVILLGAAQEAITPIRVYSAEEALRLGLVPEPPSPFEVSTQMQRQGGGRFADRFVENLRQATARS